MPAKGFWPSVRSSVGLKLNKGFQYFDIPVGIFSGTPLQKEKTHKTYSTAYYWQCLSSTGQLRVNHFGRFMPIFAQLAAIHIDFC